MRSNQLIFTDLARIFTDSALIDAFVAELVKGDEAAADRRTEGDTQ